MELVIHEITCTTLQFLLEVEGAVTTIWSLESTVVSS